MSFTPRSRRPVHLLTLDDLASFPIWEYAEDEEDLEDRDETWVRPVDSQAVPRGSYTIVAADFCASCGRKYRGCVSVSRLEDPPEIFNGVIYEGDSYYLVPNPELSFFDEAMADLLRGVRLSESELFPISYKLGVPFDGECECRSGFLRGPDRVQTERRDLEDMLG